MPIHVLPRHMSGPSWMVLEIAFWLLLIGVGIAALVLKIRRKRAEKEVEELMKRGDPGSQGPRNPWEDL